MAQFRYSPLGFLFLYEQDDPDEAIDEILDSGYPYEFCFAGSFNPAFLTRLLRAGFLLMSTELHSGFFIAQPCHHLVVSVLFFDSVHIPRQAAKRLDKYELRFDVDFDTIVNNCVKKHGDGWLTEPLVDALKKIKQAGNEALTFTSFGLYRNGRLVAGEFGSKTGRIYTSYSGYYDESGAGTVQMILTAQYLREHGYAFWNLGMPLPYKTYLGGCLLELHNFIPLWRKYVDQTPRQGMAFEAAPAAENCYPYS